MEVKVNTCIHNKFDIEVRDAKTNQLKEQMTAYNIILDQYFKDVLGFYSANYIHFGRGTGTLDVTRTTMFDKISSKSSTTVETVYAYPTGYVKKKIVLNPEEFVGETITEVGLGSNILCTHALLKDSEGNPLSIKKTATDIVTIYATLYCTLPSSFLGGKGFFAPDPAKNWILKHILSGLSSSDLDYLEAIVSDNQYNSVKDIYINKKGSVSIKIATKDYTNKILKSNTVRFDVNTGNGLLKSLGFGMVYYGVQYDVFGVNLPCPEIWTGYQATDKGLGIGDGATKDFDIKCIIRDETDVVKVAGVQKTRDVDYTIVTETSTQKVRFTNPPLQDQAVTISYITDYIPKDINHVLDVNFTIQYGRA